MSKRPRSKSDSAILPGEAKRNKTRAGSAPERVASTDHGSEEETSHLKMNIDTSLSLEHLIKQGKSHFNRFKRLGDLQDLETAIKHESRALELTPDGHPDLPDRHSDLASSYRNRFRRLGDMQDLEIAIKHESRALKLTPDGHPGLPYRYGNLGLSYRMRYRGLAIGDLQDLETAIKHESRALELTPGDHPNLPERHDNLGASYTDRFQRLGDLRDLETTIEHESRALELTPEDHPKLPVRLYNIAISYTDRFHRLHNLEDLQRVVDLKSRALSSTPDGHPSLLKRHYSQARNFLLQYQHTGDPSHLNGALDSFRKASQSVSGSPRAKFQNAVHWVKSALTNPLLNCIEAYQTAVDLLPEFIWLGATTTQRYQDLSTAEGLATNALHAAIQHSEHGLALEWLEHARCMTWNQGLMLRSPLDQLRVLHPDLAGRLQAVANQLNDNSSKVSASHAYVDGSRNSEEMSRQRRQLAKEYADLLTETRELPGFNDFLRPMKAKRLACTARYGPIVVINCHADRCDALLVLPEQDDIKRLTLTNFTEKKAREARSHIETSLRHKRLRERGVRIKMNLRNKDCIGRVLADLWHNVVKPVLDFLGYTAEATTEALPHITWCPTGALSSLPLHAAGDYDQTRARVFNYAVSSYTPTLAALFASTPTSLEHRPRIVAIGLEHTPGHNPLPGTTKELELVQAHTQGRAEYSQLIGNQVTTTAVLDAMDEHDWVHLACHAHRNVTDPTSSGFFLHDGTLDLAAISRRSFRSKGLAFLSACQTAAGDEKLPRPDEAIHLASGMLMAGYPSVIGTMWSVDDDDAPVVADRVYSELMKEGKYRTTSDPSHLSSGLDSFRRASQSVSGSPRVKFRNALNWAKGASTNPLLSCIEAYQTTIDLLPEFIWLGASTTQRYRDLSDTESLATNAACAAIQHSEHRLALEWLEHARCVVWNQSLMLRSPLDKLRASHPDLAARLQAVANQLNDAGSKAPQSRAPAADGSVITNSEEMSQQRCRLAKEYTDLLSEARELPGFEGFLQPMKAKRLVCAARYGPIVVINCHADRCDTLIVLPDQDDIKHLPLTGFTEKNARDAQSEMDTSLRNKRLRERGVRVWPELADKDRIGKVLAVLWRNIVKPVLEFLGYMNKATTGILPHITWCPTGALSSLPFHAAGDFDQPRGRVFDYAVSSYTPTLTSLLASTPSILERPPRVLAIGLEYTPGHVPLPGTTNELEFVEAHTHNRAEYSQLTGSQATTMAVLDAMDEHDWVHLACHAHQNVTDPTSSGFFLHDGTLDLAALNRRSFRGKGLAFLSACQTAMGDEKLPDEAIHLAPGMLMAGYPSVIATMWSVVDDDAPVVADRVYGELMKEGKVGNGEAGRALHCAIAGLREKVGEKEFARWVPYVHIGS